MSLKEALEIRFRKQRENETLDFGNLLIDSPETVKIGSGVYLGNWVHIRPNVEIGDGVEIRDHVFLAEGCVIGANTRIFQFANIAAGCVIGKNCFIGHGTLLSNDKKIVYPLNPGESWKCEPVIVEDNVRIGFGARILPGVRIAEGCVIGAGAVVTRSTEPDETYVGNPARPILRRCGSWIEPSPELFKSEVHPV